MLGRFAFVAAAPAAARRATLDHELLCMTSGLNAADGRDAVAPSRNPAARNHKRQYTGFTRQSGGLFELLDAARVCAPPLDADITGAVRTRFHRPTAAGSGAASCVSVRARRTRPAPPTRMIDNAAGALPSCERAGAVAAFCSNKRSCAVRTGALRPAGVPGHHRVNRAIRLTWPYWPRFGWFGISGGAGRVGRSRAAASRLRPGYGFCAPNWHLMRSRSPQPALGTHSTAP